jgi:hypothetical protein
MGRATARGATRPPGGQLARRERSPIASPLRLPPAACRLPSAVCIGDCPSTIAARGLGTPAVRLHDQFANVVVGEAFTALLPRQGVRRCVLRHRRCPRCCGSLKDCPIGRPLPRSGSPNAAQSGPRPSRRNRCDSCGTPSAPHHVHAGLLRAPGGRESSSTHSVSNETVSNAHMAVM